MIGLLAIGFVAGMIAGISPCILPILPVVFVGWTDPIHDATHPFRARRRRDAGALPPSQTRAKRAWQAPARAARRTRVLEWFNPHCPFVNNAHLKGSLVDAAKRHELAKLRKLLVKKPPSG